MFLEPFRFEGAISLFDLAQQQAKEDCGRFSRHREESVVCDSCSFTVTLEIEPRAVRTRASAVSLVISLGVLSFVGLRPGFSLSSRLAGLERICS